jgi:hypothetical protein
MNTPVEKQGMIKTSNNGNEWVGKDDELSEWATAHLS